MNETKGLDIVDLLASYVLYFPVGTRIKVGIPFDEDKLFLQTGTIFESADELIRIDLDIEAIPADVELPVGSYLELQAENGNRGNVYCRGIMVAKPVGNRLELRLIDNVVSEPGDRYFFMNMALPARYCRFLEQNQEVIETVWDTTGSWSQLVGSGLLPGESDFPEQLLSEIAVESLKLDEPPLAAFVGASGYRMIMHERFKVDEYAGLELYHPYSQSQAIPAIVQVVQVNPVYASKRNLFDTLFVLRHIKDADQAGLRRYIMNMQEVRHYDIAEKILYTVEAPSRTEQVSVWRKVWSLIMAVVLLVLALWAIIYGIMYYQQRDDLQIIKNQFEEGIGRYLKKNRN